jgi:predicted short-subunit dehydrogenase-like oxidoreductase (DUF2520 family)
VILGAGNVATQLARHLHDAGHTISCIYSRDPDHASILASEVEAASVSNPEELPDSADYFLVAVTDQAIPGLMGACRGKKGIWMHTAGSVGMDVFGDDHPECGVFYPLQTITRDHPLRMDEVPILVEGSSPKVAARIMNLAQSISRNVHIMDSEKRLVVHMAAVFASNFTNHMVHIAQQILEDQQVDPDLLVPLMKETIRKASDQGAGASRTGPAVRGDTTTMRKHLEMLESHPEWEKLYTFISRELGRTGK